MTTVSQRKDGARSGALNYPAAMSEGCRKKGDDMAQFTINVPDSEVTRLDDAAHCIAEAVSEAFGGASIGVEIRRVLPDRTEDWHKVMTVDEQHVLSGEYKGFPLCGWESGQPIMAHEEVVCRNCGRYKNQHIGAELLCSAFSQLTGQRFSADGGFPWCDACRSYHHPNNTTCVLIIGTRIHQAVDNKKY